jgi:hypothetical protein
LVESDEGHLYVMTLYTSWILLSLKTMKTTNQSRKGLSVVAFLIFSLLIFNGVCAQTSPSFTYESLLCSNSEIDFINTSTIDSGDTVVSYQWFYDGAQVEYISQPNAVALWETSGNKTVSLRMYLSSGDSIISAQNIDIKSSPIADFEVTDICCDDELVTTNKSTIDSGELTYKWVHLDYDTSKTSCENAGEQRLVLFTIAKNGCFDQEVKTYTIRPEVDASFTYSHSGRTFEFIPTEEGNDNYRWSFSDGGRSSVHQPTYTFIGDYIDGLEFCLATKKGNCWSQSCQKYGNVGVDDLKADRVSVYPNPSTGLLTIENKNSVNYTIQVSDLLGHKVNFIQTDNMINLSDLEDGIYILELKGENYSVTKKVVLRR